MQVACPAEIEMYRVLILPLNLLSHLLLVAFQVVYSYSFSYNAKGRYLDLRLLCDLLRPSSVCTQPLRLIFSGGYYLNVSCCIESLCRPDLYLTYRRFLDCRVDLRS